MLFLGILIIFKITWLFTINQPFYEDDLNQNQSYVTTLAVFQVASLLFDFLLFINLLNVLYLKISNFKSSRFILLISCIFQFLVNIGLVQLINVSLRKSTITDQKVLKFFQQKISFFIHTNSFIVALSIVGIYISLIEIHEYEKFQKILQKFIKFFNFFCLLVIVLIFASLIVSIETSANHKKYHGVINKNVFPILFAVLIISSIIILKSSKIYLNPPRKLNKLKVEEIELSKLNKTQKSEFAKLIQFNHKTNPGIDGQAAMALLEAYSISPLKGMKCKVLRIYKDDIESNLPTYETYKGWDALDKQNLIFDDDFERYSSVETLVEDAKPLSKNQLKKLQKKQQQKQQKKQQKQQSNQSTSFFNNETINTEEDYEKAKEFYQKLISTEAISLLTVIEDYDLTNSVEGPFGKFLSYCFGVNSMTRLMTIRFGLLGFHWPFRKATFYCSSTKKPVARSAAVMEAISHWNSNLNAGEKCSIILNPTYANDHSSSAIEASGWNTLPLPSSHVIDLRPYKGKSLSFYLKQIKYRNIDTKFSEDSGEVLEKFEFTTEDSQDLIKLWKNISNKKSESGKHSNLINPNEDFIMSMGEVNENKDRSLLFLKVNNENLASSVLYRLGDTITSDLQGIDYSQGKEYKAYFVMMQKVIEIALKEGKNFVDFGPTTSKPKLDIGCQSIPLKGAITAPNRFLSLCVKFAASNVNV
ncbi:putative membrane protein [Wickerhamomyces ciferrii]|uniref:Membrane protein n=1 Tax=Wickerhamomyces ciferrii (strain ATCC 14091 / BCRC 22168 / CBS 111 / JCM 3599 / NBRC 0793 / NRRL Y-1031 F-60-10) TaxID=1206466 RepID=K0KJD9_WICCF|nr:uncharacterized protein BN7_1145 [Wickerhamomyces ciferrii]CCH41604.1 putative membrane protein [Wickerhamomyces ciferrii]